MDSIKKNLKNWSLIILIFTAIDLVELILNVALTGFTVPKGAVTEELKTLFGGEAVVNTIILVTIIVTFVISLLALVPSLFVGLRGLKLSNEPAKTKGHIIWAIILLVFSAIGLISALTSLGGAGNLFTKILGVISPAINFVAYLMYVKYAKDLEKAL